MGKNETISSKVRNETRESILSTLIQHSLGISNKSVKTERGNQIGKEVKLSLFADDMIEYLKDPKNFTKKTPRHHKYLQQSSRIQNQFTKSNCLSIYQQRTD
jgi:hypothetical protein